MRSRSPQDERIRQLKNDLAMARTTTLKLVGPDLHDALYPSSTLKTRAAIFDTSREFTLPAMQPWP